MGKAFFTSWALWQKMTFVLACGIVVTVVIGLCKLQYDNMRIRKYSKVDKGKQAQTPEMLEAQVVEGQTVVPKQDDIPFGIRAIESGIEVDGVWISRSNTPAGSSRSSIKSGEPPKSYNNSQLELPPHVQGLQSPSAASRASSRAASSFDLATNAERIRASGSRDVSPGHNDKCTNCGHHNPARNSTAYQALEGSRQYGSVASSARRQPVDSQATSKNSSAKSSRRTSDESDDYMALPDGLPYPAAYIATRHGYYPPAAVDPRTDLDLLQSHRMSHVAETGQLTPRVRKPGNNGEWAGDRRTTYEVASTNGVDYFVPQQKTPSPPPHFIPRQKTPSPPLRPTAARTYDPPADRPIPSSSMSVPPQDNNAANQSRQAMPLLETYATRPFYLPDVYQPRGPAHQFSYDEMPIEVQTQQNNQRGDDPVLRKVNSGFEILRPGTLPSPEEEKKELPMAEKRQSKRLQKKRTKSNASGSRTSAFVEQV